MINAQELRIGNWVKVAIDEHESVYKRVGKEDFLVTRYYEPIPLTAELLEACGFKRINYTAHKKNPHIPEEIIRKDYFDYRKNTLIVEPTETGWRCFYTTEESEQLLIGDIPHFHQLQNLFFALTGKELNYQPK